MRGRRSAPYKLLGLLLSTTFVPSVHAESYAEDPDRRGSLQAIVLHNEDRRVVVVDRLASSGTCQLGNGEPSEWAVPGFLLPAEEYAVVVDSAAECAACTRGFAVTAVRMSFLAPSACVLRLGARFYDIDRSSPGSCREPGMVLCASPIYEVQLEEAGSYEVVVPLHCACAVLGYRYAVGIRVEAASCTNGQVPALLTDGTASTCNVYNQFGLGWGDLVALYGFPGDLLIGAQTDCCEQPVATEPSSWGVVKSLYR